VQLGEKSGLIARLATSKHDLDAAQHLRYQVFYEEMSARADHDALQSRRDIDEFDEVCDHLLVVQTTPDQVDEKITVEGTVEGAVEGSVEGGELVGTYRLLRQKIAEQSGGFYSQHTFDLAPLIAAKPELDFLELGRSCVLKNFRTRPVMELLWQGIWNYVRLHELDVMTGCASLEGTDIQALKLPLSFLHHWFKPPIDWSVRAHRHCRSNMNMMPEKAINRRVALKSLPPLIKAYLRLGAYIGDGAVIDLQFQTTDVLVILPVAAINPRYFAHFGEPNKKPPAPDLEPTA